MSKIILRQPKNDSALVERARCLYLSADDANDEKAILAEISKKILDKDKANSAVMVEVLSRRNKAIVDATKAIALNLRSAGKTERNLLPILTRQWNSTRNLSSLILIAA